MSAAIRCLLDKLEAARRWRRNEHYEIARDKQRIRRAEERAALAEEEIADLAMTLGKLGVAAPAEKLSVEEREDGLVWPIPDGWPPSGSRPAALRNGD